MNRVQGNRVQWYLTSATIVHATKGVVHIKGFGEEVQATGEDCTIKNSDTLFKHHSYSIHLKIKLEKVI